MKNNKLRKIFSKGPEYREPRKLDFSRAREDIISSIDDCISKWSNKNGLSSSVLSEWKLSLIDLVDKRIEFLEFSGVNMVKRPCETWFSPKI